MTLTTEQIEALVFLLTAHAGPHGSNWIAPDMETCCRAAAALRQLAEERAEYKRQADGYYNEAANALEKLHSLERECADNQRDDVWGWTLLEAMLKEIREQQKEDFDRAAKLQEERDCEDRLLRAGWCHDAVGGEGGSLCHRWKPPLELLERGPGMHPDRATAARLSEEKMNG